MRIIVNGANGRMGKELTRLIEEGYRNSSLSAAVGRNLHEFHGEADCIIDFSNHAATENLITYAVRRKLPLVVATTGHSEEELLLLKNTASKIPVFMAANMSMGVALLVELAKKAVKMMPEADIEIVEKHHNRKLDAPSGTALLLADEISEVRNNLKYNLGRSGHHKREQDEIGIHAVRVGNIVGEHEVIIGTDTQTITLKHEAHSRALFAEGAIAAAEFLVNQPAGLYSMKDIIG